MENEVQLSSGAQGLFDPLTGEVLTCEDIRREVAAIDRQLTGCSDPYLLHVLCWSKALRETQLQKLQSELDELIERLFQETVTERG